MWQQQQWDSSANEAHLTHISLALLAGRDSSNGIIRNSGSSSSTTVFTALTCSRTSPAVPPAAQPPRTGWLRRGAPRHAAPSGKTQTCACAAREAGGRAGG